VTLRAPNVIKNRRKTHVTLVTRSPEKPDEPPHHRFSGENAGDKRVTKEYMLCHPEVPLTPIGGDELRKCLEMRDGSKEENLCHPDVTLNQCHLKVTQNPCRPEVILYLPTGMTPEITEKLDKSIRFYYSMCPFGFMSSDVTNDVENRYHMKFSEDSEVSRKMIEAYLRSVGFVEVENKGKRYWFKPEDKTAWRNAASSSNKRKYGDNLN
jgi:hypothetical protein